MLTRQCLPQCRTRSRRGGRAHRLPPASAAWATRFCARGSPCAAYQNPAAAAPCQQYRPSRSSSRRALSPIIPIPPDQSSGVGRSILQLGQTAQLFSDDAKRDWRGEPVRRNAAQDDPGRRQCNQAKLGARWRFLDSVQRIKLDAPRMSNAPGQNMACGTCESSTHPISVLIGSFRSSNGCR